MTVRSKIKEIFMLALSFIMTEGKIVSWVKFEGDKFSKGESVIVVESDKTDIDVETFYDGILAGIVVGEGKIASVGAAIGFLIETEDEIAEAKAKAASKSGPYGRITPADIEAAAGISTSKTNVGPAVVPEAKPATPPKATAAAAAPSSLPHPVPGSTVVPFTTMQAAVSKNMVESFSAHIPSGVASVAINGGLITPVLQDADKLDLYLLSQKWKELVEKARAKQLQPHEYNSGTFTLSNLGMFGVDRFDAILPPGQVSGYGRNFDFHCLIIFLYNC
ncbi:hypothetical protein CRYUN_Cryun29cG0105600 [Craigia yunnanensis]